MADKSIQRAIKHRTAAAAAAKAEGISIEQWAEKHKGDKGVDGERARLALTLHHIDKHEDAEEAKEPKPNPGMRSFH
jgi:hypothetical protein